MNLDVTIERIENGYIVTGLKDSQDKHFYQSLEKFCADHITEEIREKDKQQLSQIITQLAKIRNRQLGIIDKEFNNAITRQTINH